MEKETFTIELTEEQIQDTEKAIKDALNLRRYTGHSQLVLQKVLEVLAKA
jgi:hypothetical protein